MSLYKKRKRKHRGMLKIPSNKISSNIYLSLFIVILILVSYLIFEKFKIQNPGSVPVANLNQCLAFPGSNDGDRCALKLINKVSDASICDAIRNGDERLKCFSVINATIKKYASDCASDFLGPQTDFCLKNKAVENKDPNLCNLILFDRLRDECKTEIK